MASGAFLSKLVELLARGDLLTMDNSGNPKIRTVGTDGQMLCAESANATGTGMGWKTPRVAPLGLSGAGTPSVAAGANVGGSPTLSVSSGDDACFTVAVTFGTTPALGHVATVTFGVPYAVTPVVMVAPGSSKAASLGLYVASRSTTGFQLWCNNAPTAADQMTVQFLVARPS